MLEINEKGKEKYPLLFSSLRIGNLMLPNRIFFPAWDLNWANEDGTIPHKLHQFYVNLAKNGCGTIYTGAARVSADAMGFKYTMNMFDKSHIKSNQKVCKEIEAKGAVPAIQLVHHGRQGVTTFTHKPVLAPSNVPCPISLYRDPNYKIKEMTLDDMEQVKNDFVKAAVYAAESGYKIIQVHAGHGYLLNNFLSPYTNKRTDQYGGSVENRCRFIGEIIQAIRQQLGYNIVLDIRMSVQEFVEGGLVPGDYAEIAPLIEKSGVDMMNASMSILESAAHIFTPGLEEPPGAREAKYAYLPETLKKYTTLPVGHAGFIGTLKKGEELLENRKMDLVGYGRVQFADGHFVKNTVMGKKINHCEWCGKCLGDLMNPETPAVCCSVNPKYKRSVVNTVSA